MGYSPLATQTIVLPVPLEGFLGRFQAVVVAAERSHEQPIHVWTSLYLFLIYALPFSKENPDGLKGLG